MPKECSAELCLYMHVRPLLYMLAQQRWFACNILLQHAYFAGFALSATVAATCAYAGGITLIRHPYGLMLVLLASTATDPYAQQQYGFHGPVYLALVACAGLLSSRATFLTVLYCQLCLAQSCCTCAWILTADFR
jgi:hypothetical protein